jgi:nicotinamidase-related amidase
LAKERVHCIDVHHTRCRRATTGIEEEYMVPMGPDITTSALIIVDMQNDFVHRDGAFGRRAREDVDASIDMDFLASTIPNVRRIAEAFRHHHRPVVYVTQVLKPDYSDAAFPYWRRPRPAQSRSIVEGTWGAQIIDDLTPHAGDHLVIKKGFGGFANTPLDTILRNCGVTTCVVTGVTTCVCVSTTVRGGVECNYRMIVVQDAVAEIHRDAHDAELKTMARVFADVKTTDEVVQMLDEAQSKAVTRHAGELAPVEAS